MFEGNKIEEENGMLRRWKRFYNEWNEIFKEDLEYTANFIYYQAMTVNIIYLFGLFLETIGRK